MYMRAFALGIVAALAVNAAAQAQPSSAKPISFPVVQGKTYKFEKIADGVYYATGGFGSNNVVIVNDADVMLVDTGTTPANARRFVADVKMLTNKPIKYVVNTHWHFDHTDGNQIFGPDVQVIGQEYLAKAITPDIVKKEPYLASTGSILVAQMDTLKKQIADEKDAGKKAALNKQIADIQQMQAELKELKPTPPNKTYKDKLVIQSGGREIDLLFLGRGHTEGDTVVYLPKEKIVCSGDLMESRLAYMGDAVFDEWIDTLDKLKKLDFTVDLPGHGIPFAEKSLITAYQDYLQDLIVKGNELKRAGMPADEAAKTIDLTSHAKDFPQITGKGADIRGMRRLYAWLTERGGG
ncbi:MAG TPA: MBL fold metallo-hydrolase [Micropepsaceae bacterium]|jgi:glyoxylase-like metal-dependent hydrolase (beta-lactamase superfamily II)|nr:MBL fold metallo-hydrolase [Micropepsaceae bacterium]